jgi:hypothetical protein
MWSLAARSVGHGEPPRSNDLARTTRDSSGKVGDDRAARSEHHDVALGAIKMVDVALLSMHVFDFHTVQQCRPTSSRIAQQHC